LVRPRSPDGGKKARPDGGLVLPRLKSLAESDYANPAFPMQPQIRICIINIIILIIFIIFIIFFFIIAVPATSCRLLAAAIAS
jgi:hypothetical protein